MSIEHSYRLLFNFGSRHSAWVDKLTDKEFKFPSGVDLQIQAGISSKTSPLKLKDLSNFSSVALEIKPYNDADPSPDDPTLGDPIAGTIDDPDLTVDDWENDVSQHLTFTLDSTASNIEAGTYWLVITGVTNTGGLVSLGWGVFEIEQDGSGPTATVTPVGPSYFTQTQINALLALKQDLLTDASQVEMETGTETALRSMSPLRVAQAIAALASGGGDMFKIAYDPGNVNADAFDADNHVVDGTPTNYTAATGDVQAHLVGIDTKFGNLSGGGDALTSNPLSQFAATTSAQLIGVITDETGTGALVFATSPTFTTGITVNGTIVVTGTVDGRNIATDGTKLDGIAANANNYSHPNHTGDVTSTGDGATVIANNVVTLAKLADIATASFIGRSTAATGDPEVLNAATARGILNVEDGATADQTDGEIETAYNNQVSKVSAGEITAGTEVTVRRYSPADIKSFVDTHGGGGGGDATSLQGTNIDASVGSPSDGDILVYRTAGGDFVLEAKPSGGGSTNLSWTAATSTVASDTGTDAVLTVVDGSNPGLMTVADKSKLDGIATSANNYSHPNHTGDVTSTGDGATVIANNVVTLAKLADIATASFIGRNTAATGDPEVLTAATARGILNVEDGATADQTGTEIVSAIDTELGQSTWKTQATRALLNLDTTDNVVFANLELGADGVLTVDEHSSAPETPAAGKVAVYAKADGKLYIKDDVGTETDLTSTGSGSLGSNLSSTTDDITSNNGTIRLAGSGGTNNEDLDFDFETTANTVGVSSSTGVTSVDFGTINLDANNLSGTNTGDEPSASTTTPGIAELATSAEINTGTDNTRTITPSGLAGSNYKTTRTGVVREIYIDAAAMAPRTTNGAEAATDEYATNDIISDHYLFDGLTEEGVQFKVAMPDAWNRGTIKAKFFWDGATGATASDGVTWGIAAQARSNDDAIDNAFAASVDTDDTLTVVGDLHVTAASAAITVSNTPAIGDLVWFEVTRVVGDTNDTMAEDAKLLGVQIQYTEGSTEPTAW